MLRLIVPTAALLLALPFSVQAASLNDLNLSKMLEKVAAESNVGLPREVDDNILDQGYTVEGAELIDHLSVQSGYAEQMRANPKAVYLQLGASVCRNPNYRKLMAKGAVMRYEFTENKTNRPVASARFQESDCPAQATPKKK
ncbi:MULTISPECIES: PA3611 family quorum-sensing-regulated virulence factor [unclassified Pseudomonas]|uniref:PA3611 family quorum-sensing-regulated virulence factor n=1 Tax=unclassified Pseudomonas TaxID=196821 RepID=UPI002AC91EAA|nr:MULTISPECIES: PA3611 family quorum-sensing-regulated virulence factor [unclassified Pseudomonas]MEB0045765.1 PA3611 family quorum-sensing-regulated virulence factor [Pseudomonas sp. Dout3]MEB0098132.1 PA3611 family quorum-sensing-regulated virulence factor [Pseudomonas sp. DC1.2]WPX60135.1 PA3611 family quorum-sensing-regulated virulence factor [Pseudomonas sp. DC1.2]